MLYRATILYLLLFLAVGLALTVGAPQLAAVRTEQSSAAAHCARVAADCLDSGLPEQAVEKLRTAIRLEPDVAEYHLLLAHAYEAVYDNTTSHSARDQEEMFREIIGEYRIARSLQASDLQIEVAYASHLLRAATFGASPDWEKTLSAWQYCLSLAEEERYQERPYRHFSKLRVTILLHLGRIELARHRNESAQRYFTRALDLMPDSVVAKRLLSKTHHGNAGGEHVEE